jgi:CheY-like chemotaxis protein
MVGKAVDRRRLVHAPEIMWRSLGLRMASLSQYQATMMEEALTIPTATPSVLLIHPTPKSLRAALVDRGFEVRVASTAEEGLAMLRLRAPQVVVVSLVLPRLSGLVAAERIAAQPHAPPLIATSPFPDPEAARLAIEVGCSACLPDSQEHTIVELVIRHAKRVVA